MAEPLATLSDLETELGRVLTGEESAKAESSLRYASNLVRALAPWVDTLTVVPDGVLDAVVSLAERRFTARRDGLRSAGPFAYADPPAERFTVEERALLFAALGISGNVSVSLAGPDPVV